jgi:hypothetical protein
VNSKRRLLLAVALMAATWSEGSFIRNCPFCCACENHCSARCKIPRPVRLREVRGRGLLVSAWLNSTGPFMFALIRGPERR